MITPPSTPLYAVVEHDLLERIARGEFAPGALLPSEADLCTRYKVSRITVRRALDGLVGRHLIQRTRGRGSVVCEPEDFVKSVSLTGYIDDVIPLNRHRVLLDHLVVPPEPVRRFLRLAGKSKVRCISSVNHSDELPLSYTHFYFPADCAPLITPDDFLGSLPPIRVIEKRSGRAVARAEQIVDPITANADVAHRLGVERGTALLQAMRTYFDVDDLPLESIVVRYHPLRYRFRVTLLPKIVPLRRTGTRPGERG